MNPFRSTVYVVCVGAALGSTAAAAATSTAANTPTATQPAAPNGTQAKGAMRHDMHDRHGGHGGPDGGFHRMLDQLELTPDQKTQIHALLEQSKPQMQAVHESGRANRDQLDVTPPTDPAYAGMLASAKSNAVEQIQLMSDLWTKVYAKLTPDQRARIPGIVATERAERAGRQASGQ